MQEHAVPGGSKRRMAVHNGRQHRRPNRTACRSPDAFPPYPLARPIAFTRRIQGRVENPSEPAVHSNWCWHLGERSGGFFYVRGERRHATSSCGLGSSLHYLERFRLIWRCSSRVSGALQPLWAQQVDREHLFGAHACVCAGNLQSVCD